LTRILLIDDDAVDRQSVRRALAASDLTIELVEAPDGATGLLKAQKDRYDCVLLDYRLPDVDTFELLASLLSPEGGRQAVMILTGDADPDVAVRLMRAGALDHLAKAEMTASTLARAIRYAKGRRAFFEELHAARQEAEKKSAALDTLNRQKSLLFSIIAHDLRNPFQALLGLSETLGRAVDANDNVAIKRRAGGLQQAALQAHGLMEGLFNWASWQMDSTEIELENLDLQSVANEAISGCLQAAEDKEVRIAVECQGYRVRSQRPMLATILRNLVSNAVKFTPAAGDVRVVASLSGRVKVSVIDTGVGIPPDVIDDLQRLDRRTTTTGTAGERGSGLGLLLCRDLADRLGSDLQVESVVGRGTTFSLLLPLAPALSAAELPDLTASP
jgi:signal transduction histidine kinase